MLLGTLELQLRLEGCYSLKDKRRIIRSLMDKTRRDFGISVAEVDDQDLWNVATIGVAAVGNSAAHVESILQHTLEAFESHPAVAVEDAKKEIERT